MARHIFLLNLHHGWKLWKIKAFWVVWVEWTNWFYMMKKLNIRYRSWLLWSGIIVGILVVSVGYSLTTEDSITFIDDENTGNKALDESLSTEKLELRYSNEYRSWQNTADTSFSSLFNGNRSVDLLAERPNLVILWAGYAFSKSYCTPRGHMYAINDLDVSLRTGAPRGEDDGPQPAACWACKSSDASRLIDKIGREAFYKRKWAAWGSDIVNPVACADCHEPESMELHIPRLFLIEACSRKGMNIDNISEQEMRSLVCAQCHCEYYFSKDEKQVILPWDNGYSAEDIEKYYDRSGFSDFVHKLSRAPLLKVQHPDYELAQMGIHARRGVSCGECHMPYVGENNEGYNDHHVQSPLAMIDRTCQTCHRETEETLRQDVYDRQIKVAEIRDRLETELTKAHIEAKFAWDRGATEKQMKSVLKLIRQAQWRWDFGTTSHGAAFHAPQEVLRILGDGIDKAMQARINIAQVLFKLGYSGDVSMPDISTKEKAQKYIGLDMDTENINKEKFLKTVLPRWREEAKANELLIR